MKPDEPLRGWTDAQVDAAMWGSVLVGAVPTALAVYWHIWWAVGALAVVSVWKLAEAGLRWWLTDLPRPRSTSPTKAKGDEW